ncbi:hypothetical protein HPP92_003224 [Vanilla planifolia]|uniref:Uncharacterized protein n=1 Tax=Vanilla planifolia TaxID=51239 RepID=A0A835VIP6_VANPL|nr:hypothetical protein HPP92_003224 [Vanilla planifolia]
MRGKKAVVFCPFPAQILLGAWYRHGREGSSGMAKATVAVTVDWKFLSKLSGMTGLPSPSILSRLKLHFPSSSILSTLQLHLPRVGLQEAECRHRREAVKKSRIDMKFSVGAMGQWTADVALREDGGASNRDRPSCKCRSCVTKTPLETRCGSPCGLYNIRAYKSTVQANRDALDAELGWRGLLAHAIRMLQISNVNSTAISVAGDQAAPAMGSTTMEVKGPQTEDHVQPKKCTLIPRACFPHGEL